MAEELLGMLTGALVPVAAQWSRYDDETQRRLRNTKYDLRDLRDAFTESQAWGGVVRSRLPIVMDWDTGLAIATAQQPVAQKIPTLPSLAQRPNLCQGAESFVSSMQWPPRPGMYDSRQNVTQVGELSTTALAVTYEEVRAAILGFVSCDGSTAAGRVQLYRAVNALTETVMALNLSRAEFAARWEKIFAPTSTTTDPHRDPAKSPTIGAINSRFNVASVMWLSTGNNNEIIDLERFGAEADRWAAQGLPPKQIARLIVEQCRACAPPKRSPPSAYFTVEAYRPEGGLFRAVEHVLSSDVAATKRRINREARQRLVYALISEGATPRQVQGRLDFTPATDRKRG